MFAKNVCFSAVASLLPLALLVAACREGESSMVFIGDDCDGPCGSSPAFGGGEDSGAAEASAAATPPVSTLMCEATECPYPYATCGTTTSFKCGTNLESDQNHCGACGNACPSFEPLHMGSRCVDGECRVQCTRQSVEVDYRDCNAFLDDGCEVNVGDDPNNCGGCGHKCPDGDICNAGKCGCDPGKTLCTAASHGGFSQKCVSLQSDDSHCGECNNDCVWPADGCTVMPPQTAYGCVQGQCGRFKCATNTVADCDHDLMSLGCNSNGCETDITTDPKNCGACGNVCGPDQECRDDGLGPQCYDICEKSKRTRCADGCADLLTNRAHCGDCSTECPVRPNQIPQCIGGECAFKCAPGWADCDGNPNNGCEVDTSIDPKNCGGCGVSCDYVGGQPCVEGKCLMIPCDAGVVTN